MALLSSASMAVAGAADATTTGISTTGATLIVVGLENVSNFISNTALTDSASNTWTYGTLFTGSSSRYARFVYCVNPSTSGSHTFSYLATNGAFYPVVSVLVFDNTPSGAFVSESAGAETVASGTTVQPGS